jgi:hypothetical protein
MSPEKLQTTRFDPKGMRTVDSRFYEYHTVDGQRRDITPKTNVVTFTLNDDEKNTVETILTSEEASQYKLEKIFPDWRPEKIVRKLMKHTAWLQQLLF